MKQQTRNIFFILMILGLVLSACGTSNTQADEIEPVTLEEIEGSNRHKLTLSEHAAQRLDIQTAAVSETIIDENTYLVVPYSTIIYDLTGGVWVYINPSPLTYHREEVIVETINGDSVLLKEGPPAGTMVVTVGVPELYGADTGVGK